LLLRDSEGQVVGVELVAFFEDHGAFDRILQLKYVAPGQSYFIMGWRLSSVMPRTCGCSVDEVLD
jgi:hypothetical protein